MEAHEAQAPRRPRRRRLTIVLAAIALAVGVAAGVALTGGGSDEQPADAFYAQPDRLPGQPGAILRSERFAGSIASARSYRILYESRGVSGRPVALSALLIVPRTPAPVDGRDVVALTHGTVGIARSCAVSSGRAFLPHVDGLARFVRTGYAVVVPDYEGLGTRGPHPYLVGAATAHATLDAVRATRRFVRAGASARFVAWGVGQGGHAALFTGQEAASYAPELELAGVAAGAPIANIGRVLAGSADMPAGRVLAAYTLAAWARVYADVRLDEIVTAPTLRTIERVSKRCLPVDHERGKYTLDEQPIALGFRASNPWEHEPLKGLLARNAPGAKPIPAPVIITQGRDDGLVRQSLTARFVRYLCNQGTTVQYRPSRKVAHSDLGAKTAPYVSKWIVGRFAGDPARSTC